MGDVNSRWRTHPSLLIRLRDAQDAEAWNLFVQIYGPLIFRHCRRQGLQSADCADIAQEVLAQVARSMRTFTYQPDKGRFRDWLGAVVRSKIGRFYRKGPQGTQQRTEPKESPIEEMPAPEADPDWTGEFHAHVLRVALERIRPKFELANWRAFELVWLEDQPASAVAKMLDVPVAQVYTAKSRVLKRLREEILLLAEDLPGAAHQRQDAPNRGNGVAGVRQE